VRLISHPVLCNYYVTYRCNASCSFCDIWEKPSPYVTLEQAEANFRDLKRLGVKVIDFTGGEPLLHQQLDQLLALAKSMGFITTVTTNTLLYPKYAERLKGKVDMLHFSLDSVYKAEHDASRGVACYDFFVESLRIAKELGERPDILFTVFEKNIGQIEEVYQKFALPNNIILILNPVFDYNGVETNGGLSPQALAQLEKLASKKLIYLNKAFLALRKDGGNHINDPVCKAASSTIVISPENKLLLPCYHLGIEALDIQNNLYGLYTSESVQKLIKLEGRYKQCEGCAINCYMQPSFAVDITRYFWMALPSTLKYNRIKGTWKNLL
jgi:MoaA/NifB/PqqE/SkfB family radical SAM enzyme